MVVLGEGLRWGLGLGGGGWFGTGFWDRDWGSIDLTNSDITICCLQRYISHSLYRGRNQHTIARYLTPIGLLRRR